MEIRTLLFIGIYLIIASFFPVTIAAQDNLPYCLMLQPNGPNHDLGKCLSEDDKQKFLGGKKIEDVQITFGTSIGSGEIKLLNSREEALQEYDKVIAETQNNFQRHRNGKDDRIEAQNLNIGNKSTLLLFMQATGFFSALGMKDLNTEGLGWVPIAEMSKTVFVQDNCLVYFGGWVSLRGYGNNYIDYHKVDKQGRSVEYWQIINTHPNFDHGKQYLIDQSTELAKVFIKNIKGKCSEAPQKKNTQQAQNPNSAQDQALPNDQQPQDISQYTQALVVEAPWENDFKKVQPSDFKIVYPESTSSAIVKPATQSANITGSIFIGKVGSEGELILQLPSGKEVKLEEDKSAFEGERPYLRWRDKIGTGQRYVTPKRNIYIKEIDCHILLEQERRDQESLQRLGAIRYASDWGVDDTIIVKPTGDCAYLNEGGPIRVLAGLGQITFKTPGGTAVSADNADFGIGYNAKSAISIVEVYNGSITVTNGADYSKTISTIYGSEIKRIEIDKNNEMAEKIAIPGSEWEAFLASRKTEAKNTNTNGIMMTVIILGASIGGTMFFLYRTGKLKPFYKKYREKIAGFFLI
ncbi:hypothetical protein HYS29_01225 [Candidatus Microgenomates bacterium]|nr:hypothetical protein [Candidatus Microgenomates bacterium]